MSNSRVKTTRTKSTQKKQGKARTKDEVFALVSSVSKEIEEGARSIEQACSVLNVSRKVLYNYFDKYPELVTRIEVAKERYRRSAARRFDATLSIYGALLARHENAYQLMQSGKPYSVFDMMQTKDYLKLLKDKSDLELKALAKIDPENWGEKQQIDHTTKGESFNDHKQTMKKLDSLAKKINAMQE